MNRRAFAALIAGAAGWPLVAHAQPAERVRQRIGVLTNFAENNPEAQWRHAAFLQRLQQLGWTEGRNLQVDYRWTLADAERSRRYADELVALAPDLLLSTGTVALGQALRATRTIPIVFTIVPDPVGAGFVDSLSRPGGNATGFMLFDYSFSGKWLELLKDIAPKVMRAAVLRDVTTPAGNAQFGAIQAVAPSLGVEVIPVNVREPAETERAVAVFARSAHGGLVVTGSASATRHRHLFVPMAERHKLPAVFTSRFHTIGGGLISYGPDFLDEFRRAAGYVDRILKGEKPGELPVQAPVKYELAINLKTAKTLGVEVPPMLIARADEVIE